MPARTTSRTGVCDLAAACATANVAVTVDPHPVLGNDATTTLQDTPVTIDVLANDDGGFGTLDPTSLTIATPAGHGSTLVDAVTHTITYTPNSGYAGTDTLTYQVCDTSTICATANRLDHNHVHELPANRRRWTASQPPKMPQSQSMSSRTTSTPT